MTTTYQEVYTDRKPTDAKIVPDDILHAYQTINLTAGYTSDEYKQWSTDLRLTIDAWLKNTNDNGMEPDFDVYRQWLNDITDADNKPYATRLIKEYCKDI